MRPFVDGLGDGRQVGMAGEQDANGFREAAMDSASRAAPSMFGMRAPDTTRSTGRLFQQLQACSPLSASNRS